MKKVNVLVTGATAPGFVSIVRSLRKSRNYKFHIIGTDYRINPSSHHFADDAIKLPDNRSDEFPKALVEVCQEKDVQVVLPIRTDDQTPLCKNLESFHKIGTEVALTVTSPDLLDTMLNKRRLLEYCRDVIGIQTPNFAAATTSSELRTALSSLGYPDLPVAIKPSYSNGSRGFRILDEQLDKRRMFFEEKPTGIFTTAERVLEDIGDEFPEMVVMDYLPGTEYTIDVLCRKGLTFAALPRHRSRTTGGITTKGTLSKDSNYEDMTKFVESIVEGFGASYIMGIQMKEDIEGNPLILEINPRLQGTTIISVEGGVNIPDFMVQMALNEFDYDMTFDVKWGLELERVWLELFSYEGRTWQVDE